MIWVVIIMLFGIVLLLCRITNNILLVRVDLEKLKIKRLEEKIQELHAQLDEESRHTKDFITNEFKQMKKEITIKNVLSIP